MGIRGIVGLLALLSAALPAAAADFYVAPNGSASNAGSLSSPWDLQTALNQPSAVQPGSTIWLRGGTYSGSYRSNLVGTAAAPIVLRAYPGERPILDGHNAAARSSGVVLSIYGAHAWFWGFEIMSSDPAPVSESSGPNVPNGIFVNESHHIKLINLLVHDLPGQGIGFWSENTDSEILGCIVYYNGLNGWDHGIYLQNQTGVKKLGENIIFQQASHGIHAYGSTAAYLDNIHLVGNTVFNNGYLIGQGSRNILVGGGRVAANPVIQSNSTYFSGTMGNSNIGYLAGASNATVTGNTFIAGNVALRLIQFSGTFTGNLLAGEVDPSNMASLYPSNTYLANRPTSGLTTVVRPNPHEAGRAHLTIYNWARQSSVAVNLAPSGLATGSSFAIRDAQNYFAAPVVTGTYDGNPVSIPMSGLTTALPVRTAYARPVHTGPEFGAFVLIPLSAPTLPAAPSNLTATAVSTSRIDLAWSDNSSSESGFELQRAPASTGPWAALAAVGSNVTATADTGVAASTTYHYRVRATSGAGASAWSNVAQATTPGNPPPPPPPPPSGSGLRGEYFNNLDFTASALVRTDATVDFAWGAGSPDPSIGVDTYSVRWTGRVQAAFSETTTFFAVSDDGVRLRVNGQLLIDRWIDQPATESSGSLPLVAGEWYPIELEYYENGGDAVARLLWSSASTPKGTIPTSRLSPVAGANPNLLANPGFEEGALAWTGVNGGTTRIVAGWAHGGSSALEIAASKSASPLVRQAVAASEGKSYTASGWVKTDALFKGAKVRVAWRNASGSTLRTDLVATVAGTQGWTPVSQAFLSPAGTTQAVVQLLVAKEPDGAGWAWFDDASLVLQSGSGSMAASVPDPDDEDGDGLFSDFEVEQGTHAQALDTDGDGLSDDQEKTAAGWTLEEIQAGEAEGVIASSEESDSGSSCGLLGIEVALALGLLSLLRKRQLRPGGRGESRAS